MDGVDGIGEAVTGGMAARAIERAAGEGHGARGLLLGFGLGGVFDGILLHQKWPAGAASASLYRDGAMLFSNSFLGAECLAWSRV